MKTANRRRPTNTEEEPAAGAEQIRKEEPAAGATTFRSTKKGNSPPQAPKHKKQRAAGAER